MMKKLRGSNMEDDDTTPIRKNAFQDNDQLLDEKELENIIKSNNKESKKDNNNTNNNNNNNNN